MDITYSKKDGFKVATKHFSGVLDPTENPSKLKDLVLLSTGLDQAKPEGTVFDSPGEYEVQGCMIDGIDLGDGKTGYALEVDGLRTGYIPAGVESLNDKQIEVYDSLDILILPVVGEKAEATNKIIGQFEPRVIIPYDYDSKQFELLGAEFGGEVQKTERFKVNAKDLDVEKQVLVAIK
ncbi:MBL fold metallo-hydrolase [Candidatus Saccharibacteria bacterium]|nr:MBL fold metallo-hydrolase [Candidatus Saccharibacteria bacterium]